MGTVISILIILVCLLLIMVVLVQNSKGGGLASSFASSNQVMGVRKTADFLEKATWTLAIALLVLSLVSTAYNTPVEGTSKNTESVTKQKGGEAGTSPAKAPAAKKTSAPAPATPAPTPPAPAQKK